VLLSHRTPLGADVPHDIENSRILCDDVAAAIAEWFGGQETRPSRMTTAFSRLPPRISPFLIRNSISSKKQKVRAWAKSLFQLSGVSSTLKNCENRPVLSALVQEIFR